MPHILSQIIIYVNTHMEYINNMTPPIKKPYLPIFLDNTFPKTNPKTVNIKLIRQKIRKDKNRFEYK